MSANASASATMTSMTSSSRNDLRRMTRHALSRASMGTHCFANERRNASIVQDAGAFPVACRLECLTVTAAFSVRMAPVPQ